VAERPDLRTDDDERGSAVVDFVMVSLLIVALLLAVLQVAVYVHVRNVVTASAQEGARYAANADVDSASGAARAVEVVARATSTQTAGGLSCGMAHAAG
jgi:Flp pilus assembly protein TadG